MTISEINETNTNIAQPDLVSQFKTVIERRMLENYGKAECFLALGFHQGKREMFQINVHATQLPSLLRADPSDAIKNDPSSGKNRPVDKEHAKKIKQYIVDRVQAKGKWILGTLTANVSAQKIKIDLIWGSVYLVTIPRGVFLDITDGQHRTRAIQELIMSEGDGRDIISNDYLPITLVLEDDLRQCQTDFRDMAQTKPISDAQLVSFGGLGSDGITQKLVEQVPMFQGKTQKIKASPGSGTKFIYTSNYVAKAVSCAFANDPNNKLLDRNVEESAKLLSQCLNQFFSECSDTKSLFERKVEELTVDEVSAFKEDCLLGVSVGLEILGRLLYYTYEEKSNSFDEVMVSKLAKLDWSRKSPLWENNVVRLDTKSKDSTKPYKITASTSAVATAVKVVKDELGWRS